MHNILPRLQAGPLKCQSNRSMPCSTDVSSSKPVQDKTSIRALACRARHALHQHRLAHCSPTQHPANLPTKLNPHTAHLKHSSSTKTTQTGRQPQDLMCRARTAGRTEVVQTDAAHQLDTHTHTRTHESNDIDTVKMYPAYSIVPPSSQAQKQATQANSALCCLQPGTGLCCRLCGLLQSVWLERPSQ